HREAQPFVAVLSRIHRWSGAFDYARPRSDVRAQLTRCNAFQEDLRNYKLVFPELSARTNRNVRLGRTAMPQTGRFGPGDNSQSEASICPTGAIIPGNHLPHIEGRFPWIPPRIRNQ